MEGKISGPTELPYEVLARFRLPIINKTPIARNKTEAKRSNLISIGTPLSKRIRGGGSLPPKLSISPYLKLLIIAEPVSPAPLRTL